MNPMDVEEGAEDMEDDDGGAEEENRTQAEHEPPAFGVEGEGGDNSAVLESLLDKVRRTDSLVDTEQDLDCHGRIVF